MMIKMIIMSECGWRALLTFKSLLPLFDDQQLQDSLKLNKQMLAETKDELRDANNNVDAKVDAVRKELIEEMQRREDKLSKQLAKVKRHADKEAAQYARETAERDFNSTLATMELSTVPFIR